MNMKTLLAVATALAISVATTPTAFAFYDYETGHLSEHECDRGSTTKAFGSIYSGANDADAVDCETTHISS
ncbi:MAG: hypothetical protein GXP01_07625 [Alphaproteobacteria bacterium]|nr:hypothetical protein [Alphaproteobacteria bacterium]